MIVGLTLGRNHDAVSRHHYQMLNADAQPLLPSKDGLSPDQPATEADVLALLNWQFMNELIIAKFVIIKSASSYGGLAGLVAGKGRFGGPYLWSGSLILRFTSSC